MVSMVGFKHSTTAHRDKSNSVGIELGIRGGGIGENERNGKAFFFFLHEGVGCNGSVSSF